METVTKRFIRTVSAADWLVGKLLAIALISLLAGVFIQRLKK
jgi:hypothetical protein